MAHVKGFLIGVCAAYNNADITFVAANTATAITYNTNVRVIGQVAHSTSINPSRITINSPCYAEVTFSAQTLKGAAGTQSIYFWFRANGVDIPFSTRTQQLDNGEEDNFIMVFGDFFDTGDYIEIYAAVGATTISLNASPATAFSPAAASARIKVITYAVDNAGTPSI